MKEYGLFVDGQLRPAAGGRSAPVINPATEEPWAIAAVASVADVDAAVEAAHASFAAGTWRGKSPEERAAILDAVGVLISERADELALAEIRGAGWTHRLANVAAIMDASRQFGFYAELIRAQPVEDEAEEWVPAPSRNFVRREPFGVCACITPFNFPLASAAWKIAPALAAGNSVVVKPAPLTPVSAILIAQLCKEAGVPDGVVNVITGPGQELGEALVRHPKVAKVSFTGSTAVGRRILEAGAATLKSVTLELGGKSPFIVLEDANLDGAVPVALWGTFFNSGQVCMAGTRLLVHRSRHGELVERLVAAARRLHVGDPMDLATGMGPLISAAQRANVERFVAIGKSEGARCVTGGRRPEHLPRGFFYEPTVFDGVTNQMQIARDEIFGPVLSVIPFSDDQEALRIANDTSYGLAASVWSTDLPRARRLANRIEAGTVWINDHNLLNVRFPFGGYKQSGLGRELGPHGLAEYQQIKHVHVGEAAGEADKPYVQLVLD